MADLLPLAFFQIVLFDIYIYFLLPQFMKKDDELGSI